MEGDSEGEVRKGKSMSSGPIWRKRMRSVWLGLELMDLRQVGEDMRGASRLL